MTLPVKTIDQLNQMQVSAIQAKSTVLTDFRVGSDLLALVESNTSLALFLQALLQTELAVTRLGTSKGADVDSYLADFFLKRLAAAPSSGNVTFSRYTASGQSVVPVGALVETAENSSQKVQFKVTVDTENPNYDALLNGYILSDAISSISVPVTATTNGSSGNVGAGVITVLSVAIPGVDTVTNTVSFANGHDEETDDAARTRFIHYLAGLAKASVPAIKSAIEGVRVGIEYSVVENIDYATGVARKGYFYDVIGNNPSADLLQDVYEAIDATRACGIQFESHAEINTVVNVSVTVTKSSTADATVVHDAVVTALTTYINEVDIGSTLYYSNLYQVILDAAPGDVVTSTGLLVNGGTANIATDTEHEITAGTITVTVV
jgi:uncharacterized phage protein gp47/JayE